MASLPFLPQIITFPDIETAFERLDPITDFRQCHGVIPFESRILYRCRRISSTPSSSQIKAQEEDYILKIKIQIPDPNTTTNNNDEPPPSSPDLEPKCSNATTHELSALRLFRSANSNVGPHLVAFQTIPQSVDGLLPGGYISCTVMNKLPGKSLFDLGYWSLSAADRTEIEAKFLEALAEVRKLGIEPGDKGLRNVMWDGETKRCGLVDFELWHPYSGIEGDSTQELQKWGLAHKPPAKNWWAEFGIHTH